MNEQKSTPILVLAILLALLLSACGGAMAGAAAPPAAQGPDCPVTVPPAPPFVPPQPWPAEPPDEGRFWYGDEGLWTALPRDGRWAQLALGEKLWWWSAAFDVQREPQPALAVTARRLDGAAPPFATTGATNGYHPSFHWAMLTGAELASPGCWEITGRYQGRELSYTVFVPASP